MGLGRARNVRDPPSYLGFQTRAQGDADLAAVEEQVILVDRFAVFCSMRGLRVVLLCVGIEMRLACWANFQAL